MSKQKISVIGLGYVGLPLAVAFSKKTDVIGFDTNVHKICAYNSCIDPSGEIGNEILADCTVLFTSDAALLKNAAFHIVAVPTPVNQNNIPDLTPLKDACEILGRNLAPESVVVFESTVYPGVTENICVPILEKESGLKCGAGFKVGYSPERINPGDKVHRLENITKIVSGMDDETTEKISDIYNMVIDAGVYKVSSIKTAEAIKVIENSQRDINIAFMNEVAMMLHCMGIDTQEVIDGMNTKWNALGFYPGLVGGHCIGIDPYYILYEAESLGYQSQIILSGRQVNNAVSGYISEQVIEQMSLADKIINRARIAVLGVTFKENCSDTRNSKVFDVIQQLREHGAEVLVYDPLADKDEVREIYKVELADESRLNDLDAIIISVAHDEFKSLNSEKLRHLFRADESEKRLIFDVKSIFSKKDMESSGYVYWRL